MLALYPNSTPGRTVYSLLLCFAIVGPVVGPILSYSRFGPKWLEAIAYVLGVAAIACLCAWCAIYVRDEPLRVRLALGWIGILFLFLTLLLCMPISVS
jgi:uncharacterized membrane protein YfcA